MGLYNTIVIASAVLSFTVISPAYAQLADNLMVSGSEKPMAYGVGTYGLKGAGTQGVSGQSEAGGLYSARIPTVTLSRSVPGVMVSDGKQELVCISASSTRLCLHRSLTGPLRLLNYVTRCGTSVLASCPL